MSILNELRRSQDPAAAAGGLVLLDPPGRHVALRTPLRRKETFLPMDLLFSFTMADRFKLQKLSDVVSKKVNYQVLWRSEGQI